MHLQLDGVRSAQTRVMPRRSGHLSARAEVEDHERTSQSVRQSACEQLEDLASHAAVEAGGLGSNAQVYNTESVRVEVRSDSGGSS